MLVKRLVQLQFCLDKADKPQVMFYFPEIKETYFIWRYVNVKVLLTRRGFTIQINSGFRILLS